MRLPLSRKNRGFTLIELLVVIAIIAILAAILLPVFAAARERARQTSCASNMKQLSLGILQYTQDFDELLPIVVSQNASPGAYRPLGTFDDGSYGGTHLGWVEGIYPYVKSTGVFYCPSDVQHSNGADNVNDPSYSMNCFLGWYESGNIHDPLYQPGCSWSSPDVHDDCFDHSYGLGKINSVANIVLLGEVGQSFEGTGAIAGSRHSYTYPYMPVRGGGQYAAFDPPSITHLINGDTRWVIGNHSNGGNFAFCDGHVKFVVGQPDKTNPGTSAGSWADYVPGSAAGNWQTHWYPED